MGGLITLSIQVIKIKYLKIHTPTIYNLIFFFEAVNLFPPIPTFPLLNSQLARTFDCWFKLNWHGEKNTKSTGYRDYTKICFHDDEGLSRK